MTTINLHQNKREEMVGGIGKVNSSLAISIVIVVILSLAWGSLKVGAFFINKKNTEVLGQISAESVGLSGKKNIDEVIDLQERIKLIKGNITNHADANEVMSKIAGASIPGVTFTSYSSTDKKILVSFKAANFNDISKQIFNFKQADFITGVNVSNIVRDEQGVKSSVEISLK